MYYDCKVCLRYANLLFQCHFFSLCTLWLTDTFLSCFSSHIAVNNLRTCGFKSWDRQMHFPDWNLENDTVAALKSVGGKKSWTIVEKKPKQSCRSVSKKHQSRRANPHHLLCHSRKRDSVSALTQLCCTSSASCHVSGSPPKLPRATLAPPMSRPWRPSWSMRSCRSRGSRRNVTRW